MNHYQVVAAVIRHEGKYLCMQKGVTKYAYTSHKFEFPGGKIEPGETPQQALKREIREEMDMDIEVGEELVTVHHRYPDFELTMTAFLCHASDAHFCLKEHAAFRWVEREHLKELDWAQADVGIAEAICGLAASKLTPGTAPAIRISRCYLEITNICNLDCAFCPKTDRAKRRLTIGEFDALTDKLHGKVKFLYFHLMGEPFVHPQLPGFVAMARKKGFVPVLTTNGTLLAKGKRVIEAIPHKIQISLHSHEGNGKENPEAYIGEVMEFAREAARKGIIVVMRLWNQGGFDSENGRILEGIAAHVPTPWTERHDGWKLETNLYIEYDRMFEWPDAGKGEYGAEDVFCYALRNQIGVLVDGSVVPCCLDHAGDIVLGNLFTQSFEEIVESPRARALYDGFTKHVAVEPLCRRCGYAVVTKQYRK